MIIERLPVLTRPGFDCRNDNANCPGCKIRPADHGISGGRLWFAVSTTYEGQRVALSLEVLGIAFPPTVPMGARRLFGKPMSPIGAMLVIHREALVGGNKCEFLGGARCDADIASYWLASEFYERHGNLSTDPATDFTQQSEAFWRALERRLEEWGAPREAREDAS